LQGWGLLFMYVILFVCARNTCIIEMAYFFIWVLWLPLKRAHASRMRSCVYQSRAHFAPEACYETDCIIFILKRILNVLIALALRNKLFTAESFNRVLNWSLTPLYCTIVLLIVIKFITLNIGVHILSSGKFIVQGKYMDMLKCLRLPKSNTVSNTETV
jgi:hypothetical protein